MGLYLTLFFGSLITSITLLPFLISFLKENDIVDRPNFRKKHQNVIPRMGGLILVGVIYIVLATNLNDFENYKYLIAASIIIPVSGILDDIFDIRWSIKFILQAVSAFLIILYFDGTFEAVNIFGLTLNGFAAKALLFVFIIGFLNSFNLMDGADGLVTGFSIIIFISLLILGKLAANNFTLIISSSAIGVLIGILYFNLRPARIFLGDTGSFFIANLVLVLSMTIANSFNPGVMDLTFVIILNAIPIVDTVRVMFFRMLEKRFPFHPDRTHLHHLMIDNGIPVNLTVQMIHFISIFYAIIAINYLVFESLAALVASVVLTLPVFFVKYLVRFSSYLKTTYQRLVNYLINIKLRSLLSVSLILLVSTIVVTWYYFSDIILLELEINSLNNLNLMIISALFFGAGLVNFYKTTKLNHIFVLINFSLFFVFIYSNTISFNDIISSNANLVFTNVLIGLAFMLAIALYSKVILAKAYHSKKTVNLFPSTDLFLLNIAVVMILVNVFSPRENQIVFTLSLISAGIMYIAYRILLLYKRWNASVLFYTSFFILLTSMLIVYV